MREQNNKVTISGKVVSDFEITHEVRGERFGICKVEVPRLSGTVDTLPVMISERLIPDNLHKGDTINAIGQYRSYNKIVNGKSRLILFVFIQQFLDETPESPNEVVLSGYICKEPQYRITPMNREIADLVIAVNRGYNKSDYISCIAWGRNAQFVKSLNVGNKLTITGRIQSREYNKVLESGVKTLTAYEVSISSISIDAED